GRTGIYSKKTTLKIPIIIDIGSPAISGNASFGKTAVNKKNPANATGVITSVEIYANEAMTGVKVATFYIVSGNILSTRDYDTIGDVPIGYSKHTVSINVNAGDYIGIYCGTGKVEAYTPDYTGMWYWAGDGIPCSEKTFSPFAEYIIRLYGTGEGS
ncbi:unnamed protein product, partial [marine sediment metagenome]